MSQTPGWPDGRYYVCEDEWWPVYSLVRHELDGSVTDIGEPLSLTAEEWADYQRVMAEFEAWQQRLKRHSEAP